MNSPIIPIASVFSNEEAITLLGPPNEVFKPDLKNMAAGLIIAALMICGGGTLLGITVSQVIKHGGNLPFWAEKNFSWFSGIIMSTIGLALLVGAVFLILWVHKIFALRVYVCDKGLFYSLRNKIEVFPWDDLDKITEIVVREHLPIVKKPVQHLMPEITNRSYSVARADQVKFTFTGDHVKNINRLGALLSEASNQHDIPWQTVEDDE